jgi:nitrogen regulatory protein P-II 1
MIRIEAIIRPEKVSEVCIALDRAGHPDVTLSRVDGCGAQKGWVHHLRSSSFTVKTLTKTKLEVVVKDEDADAIIAAIRRAALTGWIGDGRIFVHHLSDIIM